MDKILPKIMAVITRHSRRQVIAGVDFKWGKYWTHNAFRVWELIFWAPDRVRPSVVSFNGSEDDHEYGFTLEGKFAVLETMVRSLLRFKIPSIKLVRVPVLQLANGMVFHPGLVPYSFAIAIDTYQTNDGGINQTTPTVGNHTCTGSNVVLVTGIWNQQNNSASYPPSTITYNSVSMGSNLRLDSVSIGSGYYYNTILYALYGPSTGGSYPISYTYGSNVTRNGNCNISLTGCSSSFGAVNGNNAQSGTTSCSVTTTAANSLIVSLAGSNGSDGSPGWTVSGTNQTIQTHGAVGGGYPIILSTQTTTSITGYSAGFTNTIGGPSQISMSSLEIKAAGGATVNSNFLMFM